MTSFTESRKDGPERANIGKAVSFFDIDKTLVRGFSILPFAEFLVDKDCFDPACLELMKEDFEAYNNKKLNYEDFAITIVDHYSEGLKGILQSDVILAGNKFLPIYESKLFEYSKKLVEIMRNHGETIVVSGSPLEAFLPLAKLLNIDKVYLLEAEVENGRYTGRTKINMALYKEKIKIIDRIKGEGFNRGASFAFGDSIHDVPLLSSVTNGFVVGKDPELLREAKKNNWTVVDDKDILREVEKKIEQIKTSN